MPEKKMLSDEDLQQVSGGAGKTDSHIPGFADFVGMYEAEAYMSKSLDKQPLYFVMKNVMGEILWVYGKLYNSYEAWHGHRIHDVYVIQTNNRAIALHTGETYEIKGDSYSIYKTKL